MGELIGKPTFTKNEYKHYTGPYQQKAKFSSPEEEFEWAKTQTRSCNKCNESLSLTSFGTNTSGTDPFDKSGYRLRRWECIDCNKKIAQGKSKALQMCKQSGIPHKAPDGTKCEICAKTNNIVFDHHHEKNIFRGWLCDGCNRSIGMLGEKMENIVSVINYLNKTENKELLFDKENKQLSIVS